MPSSIGWELIPRMKDSFAWTYDHLKAARGVLERSSDEQATKPPVIPHVSRGGNSGFLNGYFPCCSAHHL